MTLTFRLIIKYLISSFRCSAVPLNAVLPLQFIMQIFKNTNVIAAYFWHYQNFLLKVDCCGRRIVPPPECRPGPVPPNPCCPQYPKKGIFKLYRSLFFFVCVPVIILQLLNVLSHEPCPKIPCRDYEYMRIRSKRFPWGEGVESFFHNEEVNHLPGECEPPPMICEP